MNRSKHSSPQPCQASVIIPAYNAQATLSACLDALVAQLPTDGSVEIIVVDDASTDRTAAIAKGYAQIRLLNEGGGKLGKSGTRNYGATHANGAILLFTDADCVPTPNWITTMLAAFDDPAVVGIKGTYLSRQTNPVARFVQIEHEERYDLMAQQAQIDFIDTYSAGYRRDLFLENGGFDMQLTNSMVEDQELSFRLAQQGHLMRFVPEAQVYHQHLTSPIRYVKRKFWIASWKALIVQRHPDRLRSDSRTPETLKIQMGLALLLMPIILLATVSKTARRIRSLLLFIFTATVVPFFGRVVQRDRSIALIALPMLFGRACALALGYLHGMMTWRSTNTDKFLNNRPQPIKSFKADKQRDHAPTRSVTH